MTIDLSKLKAGDKVTFVLSSFQAQAFRAHGALVLDANDIISIEPAPKPVSKLEVLREELRNDPRVPKTNYDANYFLKLLDIIIEQQEGK